MIKRILFGLTVIVATVISFVVASVVELTVYSRLTPNLIVLTLLTLLTMMAVLFGQLWLPARSIFENGTRVAGITTATVSGVVIALFVLANIAGRAVPAVELSGEALAELEEHTIPLEGTLLQPEQLEPLRPYLEGHRVVALGEATHGTSEFFELKHSITRYLVEELGYRHYGMELSPADGERLNAYIHGEGVPLPQVLYWPWATQEVVTMLDWMRSYNAEAPASEELTFHGIDPRSGERDLAMAENTLAVLEGNGPDSQIVIWAHNAHIAGREAETGYYLREELDNEVYLIGFDFNEGRFTSRTGVIDTFSVGPAPPNHYVAPLAQVSDSPVRFMDIDRVAQASDELAAWLNTPQITRNLAELHHLTRRLPGQSQMVTELPTLFDALIYVAESTPAVVLEGIE